MKKKVILIWDLDGAIGQINSTFPYNYNVKQLVRELDNVRYALDILDTFKVKSTFAITGFSAEEGVSPYTFPDLIEEIKKRGHEVASHSWRHEWIPVFTSQQIFKSAERSKRVLESIVGIGSVNGFVPPHNLSV
jgi:peptidoglycan/xylan/chitin deacetylase (PgdA/CDA1 family)